MESVQVREGVVVAYEDDCFAPPWLDSEVVMLTHGIAESRRSWTLWVPIMASSFRVIRPDLPGLGRSPFPPDYDWTPRQFASDLMRLLDALEIERLHLIGAKYGGTISMQLASDFPDRIKTLSIFSSPTTGLNSDEADRVRTSGLHQWAQDTQRD